MTTNAVTWRATTLHRSGGNFVEAPDQQSLVWKIIEEMQYARGEEDEANFQVLANCLEGRVERDGDYLYVIGGGIRESAFGDGAFATFAGKPATAKPVILH